MNRKQETVEQIKSSTTPRGRQMQFCLLALLALFCTAMVSAQGQSGSHGTTIGDCTIIDKTGFYYLSRNINAPQSSLKSRSGTYPSCILILADFVTLDLQGHTIVGPGLGPSGFAVYVPGHRGVRVLNGVVTNFERGVALEGESHGVERVRAEGNGYGFSFDGVFFSLEEVYAVGNDDGVFCFGGGGQSIQHGHFVSNHTTGIDLSGCPGNSIVGNLVSANSDGIVTQCPSAILQNVSYQNGNSDIAATVGSPACTRSDNSPLP